MASNPDFVEFVVDQMAHAGNITARKMFGEYAIYCDGKVVGLICDNQLFVKQTDGGRATIDDIVEAPPYPGAKLYLLIDDRIEDRDWICKLITLTAQELPEPKKRKPKKKRNT